MNIFKMEYPFSSFSPGMGSGICFHFSSPFLETRELIFASILFDEALLDSVANNLRSAFNLQLFFNAGLDFKNRFIA